MTPVIAGSINRTPTVPHRRCDMLFGQEMRWRSLKDVLLAQDLILVFLHIRSEVLNQKIRMSLSGCTPVFSFLSSGLAVTLLRGSAPHVGISFEFFQKSRVVQDNQIHWHLHYVYSLLSLLLPSKDPYCN